MRRKSGLMLLRLLLVFAVLCHTGFSLQCYNCIDPISPCNTTTVCSPNFDTCVIVVSKVHKLRQCWKNDECKTEIIMKKLGNISLSYRCCQKDLCNNELKEQTGTATRLGKTVLLVAPFLVAAWNLHL